LAGTKSVTNRQIYKRIVRLKNKQVTQALQKQRKVEKMKEQEFQKLASAGNPVVVVEFRSSKAEKITWRDKETKKSLSAPVVRHTVECGEVSVGVGERVDENYDVSKMTVIDDGNYQGNQIFIIPKSTYQPNVEDYLLTHTYYGSCSGCDTLEAILSDYNWDDEIEYDDQVFNEKQVSELMTLSLHLVQKMKVLGSGE